MVNKWLSKHLNLSWPSSNTHTFLVLATQLLIIVGGFNPVNEEVNVP